MRRLIFTTSVSMVVQRYLFGNSWREAALNTVAVDVTIWLADTFFSTPEPTKTVK